MKRGLGSKFLRKASKQEALVEAMSAKKVAICLYMVAIKVKS